MSKRCMVHGCENRSHQGCFVGDMCAPCYAMITSGDTSIRSTNFISKLKTIPASKYLTRALYRHRTGGIMEVKFTILPIPDSFNVNGYYYTKGSLDKAITAYKEKIADGRAPVMMGYPNPNIDDELPLALDLSKIIGQVTDIEFEDGKYVASVKFQRPTNEILDIINNKSSYAVGLNKTGQITENREVHDINILSASLALDPRLENTRTTRERSKRMNMTNEPMACKEQEISAEITTYGTLIETTFELLRQLEDKINPVLSADCIKTPEEDTKLPRLESQLGNWLHDQNIKIESANETLRNLCRRVRL